MPLWNLFFIERIFILILMKVGYIPALTFPPKVRPFSRVHTPPPPSATAHSRRAGTVRIAIPDTSKRRMHDGSQAISSSLPPQWQGLSHSAFISLPMVSHAGHMNRRSVVVYPRAQFGCVTGGERSRVRGGSMIADSENGSFSGTRNGRSEATPLVCSY